MDISKLKQERQRHNEPVAVEVKDELGEVYLADNKQPVTFFVVGSWSERVRTKGHEQTDRRWQQKAATMTSVESEAELIERAVAAVVDWRGPTANGEPWPCTPENVAAWFDAAPWTVSQVIAAAEKHKGFFSARTT